MIVYTPQQAPLEGVLPYSRTYQFSVMSPDNEAVGVNMPISITASVIQGTSGSPSLPAGVSTATALSYITISPSTFVCTGPNQTTTFTVTVNLPLNAVPGQYGYKIEADGWTYDPSLGLTNIGAFLNGTVTAATISAPPLVDITAPVDGSTISVPYTSIPASVPFTFTATSQNTNVISSVSAELDGVPIVVPTPADINTTIVHASCTLSILTPGTHTVRAYATSSDGTGSDINTFTLQVAYPPPSVVINSPAPNTQYYYRYGGAPVDVPLSFTGTGLFGRIAQLSATLDGAPTLQLATSNLMTLFATATADMLFTDVNAGAHQIHVTATDEYGQVASADTNFTVNVIAPVPAVSISAPTPGAVFTIPAGATTYALTYSFKTTVQNGYNVNTVSASLGGTSLSFTTVGLNTPTATSTGTINLPVGSYTLTATGGVSTQTASASVSFTVKAATVPPTVVITSPPVGYTQAIMPGATASVPLTFTGTSNNPGGVIKTLSATLDGASVAVSSTTLGQTSATGTATLAVTASGTHHIVVTAADAYGNATAARDFTITFLTPHQITGIVFFDLDANKVQNGADFGLAFVTVQLLNSSGQVVQSTVTNAAGVYTFTGLYSGTYTVASTSYSGLTATTPTRQTITMASANITATPIGYQLNFCALQCMKANGYSMGFWKTNLSKAISGSTKGVQVSAATLTKYTATLSQFALTPFDGLTMKQAVSIMSSTSCDSTDLLAKQLLPAEYNYENGAYINGNPALTFAFVAWGEAVMQNSKNYSSSYLLWAASWFEAYNTSEGGTISGPGSCSGYGGGSCWGGSDDDDDDSSDCSWGGGSNGSSGCSWGWGS